jgi:surface antigen
MVLIAPGHAAAAILGTLAGASIGGNIGRTMDEADRIKLGQVLERSPSYRTSGWKNPVTGYRYRVTPRQAYGYSAQTYCREYKLKSQVGGRQQEVNGRACRLPNGSWRVQS